MPIHDGHGLPAIRRTTLNAPHETIHATRLAGVRNDMQLMMQNDGKRARQSIRINAALEAATD